MPKAKVEPFEELNEAITDLREGTIDCKEANVRVRAVELKVKVFCEVLRHSRAIGRNEQVELIGDMDIVGLLSG